MPAKASPSQGPKGPGAPVKAEHLNSGCRFCCELRSMGEGEGQATRRSYGPFRQVQIWSQGLSREVLSRGSKHLSNCPPIHTQGVLLQSSPAHFGPHLPGPVPTPARCESPRRTSLGRCLPARLHPGCGAGQQRAHWGRARGGAATSASRGDWGRVWKAGCWGRAPARTSRPGLPPGVGHRGSVRVARTGERSESLARLAAVAPAPAALEKWERPRALQAERDRKPFQTACPQRSLRTGLGCREPALSGEERGFWCQIP